MAMGGSMRFQLRDARPQLPLPSAPFRQWIYPDGTLWTLFYRHSSGYLLRFPDLADFQIAQDGGDIQGWPAPGVTVPTMQNLYLNQVHPLALSHQGKLMLHASAVSIGGRCVAFLGESGRGKSTLAASFAIRGTEFLTDDGLQLEWLDGRLVALPSHPSIRLWEDSQMELIGAQPAAPPAQYTTKVRFIAGDGLAFCNEPRTLHTMFFLRSGDAPTIRIEPIRAPAALLELVRHSFLLDVDEHRTLAAHFDEISRIANMSIHYRLDYPRRFDQLPLLLEAIQRHVDAGKA